MLACLQPAMALCRRMRLQLIFLFVDQHVMSRQTSPDDAGGAEDYDNFLQADGVTNGSVGNGCAQALAAASLVLHTWLHVNRLCHISASHFRAFGIQHDGHIVPVEAVVLLHQVHNCLVGLVIAMGHVQPVQQAEHHGQH